MNPWIEHVKKFASKKGISYTQALKDPNVKKGYKPIKKQSGGATYGVPDSPTSPKTPNDDGYIDPRFNIPDEVSDMTEAMRRTDISGSRRRAVARRPQREKEEMTVRKPSRPPAGRRVVSAKKPSVEDPKRIGIKANFLRGWIKVSMDDGMIPRRTAMNLLQEIEDIVNDTNTSFSEKMDDLLLVEKSLRVFDDGEEPSAQAF